MKYISLFLASLFFLPLAAFAADLEFGSVTIEQNSAKELGTWELIYPGGVLKYDGINVNAKKQTVRPRVGPVVLSVVPPAGATARVQVYLNDELVSQEDTTQKSIDVKANENYRFVIQYIFNRNGMLGITSTEKGVQFKMVGPDGKTYRGVTPKSYDILPAGTYTIRASKEGCIDPPQYNRSVKSSERTVVRIEIDCTSKSGTQTKKALRPLPSRRATMNSVDAREKARAQRHLNR